MKNIENLTSFDAATRKAALSSLAVSLVKPEKLSDNFNMHVHSFFSFNAEEWSPSRIAWECATKGIYGAGIIDFDVIDGMNEFIEAGELLALRTSVGIETRTFVSELSDKEIDSPGEPGVSYVAAGGFFIDYPAGSTEKKELDAFRDKSHERNISLIGRINNSVPEISIDYKRDVIPLTPSANATERHIIRAYILRSRQVFEGEKLIEYWSSVSGKSLNETMKLFTDQAAFEEIVRNKFAKRGGYGYVQPGKDTFPQVADFFKWAKSCQAIPMESWLDGTSEGENVPASLLDLSVSKGAEALNIIPERNWNIADRAKQNLKIDNLRKIINEAAKRDLPLHIGTEMNKKGLPFVDDLSGPVLKEFRNQFINGANIFFGHNIAGRFADFSYTGKNAEAEFGNNKKKKNQFFAAIGALPPVDVKTANMLRQAGASKAFSMLMDRVRNK